MNFLKDKHHTFHSIFNNGNSGVKLNYIEYSCDCSANYLLHITDVQIKHFYILFFQKTSSKKDFEYTAVHVDS